MKKLTLALLLLLPISVKAQVPPSAPRQLMAVAETSQSSFTCYSIMIASYSGNNGDAVALIRSTVPLWAAAFVQNHDNSTVNIHYAEYPWVAVQTLSGGIPDTSKLHIGQEIWPASATNPHPRRIPLAPGQQIYAVCDSTSRRTEASVCLQK